MRRVFSFGAITIAPADWVQISDFKFDHGPFNLDLAAATQPRFMRLTAKFYVRGGIFTNVIAEHRNEGWFPQPLVDLSQFDTQPNTKG